MTDKEQIMVDGVNIIDCDNYYVEQETDQVKCDLSGEYCRENKNCFYKQLARKTQECEELKIKLMQKDEINTFFNTPIEGWSSDPCNICECKNNYDHYRKALEEIEEYVRDNSDFDKSDILTSKTGAYDILNIINKAKGEE